MIACTLVMRKHDFELFKIVIGPRLIEWTVEHIIILKNPSKFIIKKCRIFYSIVKKSSYIYVFVISAKLLS